MNPNWLGIVAFVLALLLFFLVYRSAKKKPLKIRVPLTVLAIVASIPGASLAAYYAHVIPEASWYYQFRSLPGSEFSVIVLGVTGALIATLLPRILLIFPLLGVAAFSLAPFVKPLVGPLSIDEMKDEWRDNVCLQSTPSTCGAASTATVLNYLGASTKESDLAIEAHSYQSGTEAWYLARVARSRGFDASFDFQSGFLPEGGLPAVVGVKFGSFGHFIAILAQTGDRFIVGDPLRGREELSQEELEGRYLFTGFHMRVRSPRGTGCDLKDFF